MSEPTSTATQEPAFTEEWLPVGGLEVDPGIQRDHLDVRKVERIYRLFNPGALGVITVSRRNSVTDIILDGWHRVEVVRRITDGAGKILAHVFKDLTPEQEAQMFLDLNAGTQPQLLDKFKVRLRAGDKVALEIDALAKAYGWTIRAGGGPGYLQAVGAVEAIWQRSVAREAEPNLLQVALLCVTRAWNNQDPAAVSAGLLTAVAALADEYGDQLKVDVLIKKMANYPGGPSGLQSDGAQRAKINRGALSMGIAEQLVVEYNKGRENRGTALTPWRRRKP